MVVMVVAMMDLSVDVNAAMYWRNHHHATTVEQSNLLLQ